MIGLPPQRSRRTRLPRTLLLLLLVLGGLGACFDLIGSPDVPVHKWWKERGPVVPHDSFPADCATCHTSATWEEVRDDFQFDHLAETGVALLGAHATAECLRCHNDRGPAGQFAERGCAGCHEDVHQGTLGGECTVCHTERDWNPGGPIAEHDRTRFPLVGAHAATACFACHENAQVGRFDRADVACVSCHTDDLTRATDPNHLAQGWTDRCDRCHVPVAWQGAGFSHSFFPLVGGHATTDCTECHAGGVYAGTPTDCSACHMDDYDATSDPNHVMAGFPLNCQQCHSVVGWSGANFKHNFFPLTGAHAATVCDACHPGGVYQGTPTTCFGCHQPEYDSTTDPAHFNAGFSTQCQQCHSTSGWDGANFNHNGFPLTGAHANTACAECHQNDVYKGTPTNCVACHQSDYDGTTDPDHFNAGFSTQCQQCHDTSDWGNATFNHDFPIKTGKHKNLSCNECHVVPGNSSIFSCIDCHEHTKSLMDGKHHDVNNYSYNSQACLSCHPKGKGD